MLDWLDFRKRIESCKRVLLTTHVRPDGDALGSQIGFRGLLESLGKEVEIFNPSITPSRYKFLDPHNIIGHWSAETPNPKARFDAIVVLDTGAWSQLPGVRSVLESSNALKFVVDHHQTQDDLGAVRYVDVSAAACGVLVYRAMRTLGVPFNQQTADALFIAIATDTGWMHHPNSSPEVFSALADLAEAGAAPAELYRRLYEQNSLPRLKLLGELLRGIELREAGKLAWAAVSRKQIAEVDAHPMDTEDFIVHLMSLTGVQSAVLFVEQEGGESTKLSFRSRVDVDCSKFAERFGGGGHRAAAGAHVTKPMWDAIAEILPAADIALVDRNLETRS